MRIKSLDSVRGVAALIVVFSHCLEAIRDPSPLFDAFPLTLLTAGDGSVFVFFALSGFVLFLSFRGKTSVSYAPYITKRFFRIYPPFMAAVIFSAILYELVRPHAVPGLSDWVSERSWQLPPTPALLLGHFALTDLIRFQGLDNVMWSLGHEVRISIVFPLIALCVLFNWRLTVVVSVVISALAAYVKHTHRVAWVYDPFRTASYIFLFTGGAALAYHAQAIKARLSKLPIWLQIALWAVALRFIAFPVGEDLGMVTGAAALLLITLSFATPSADRVLSTGVFTWLGRVSYSLYLIHLPIFMTYIHLLYGRLPLALLFSFAIVTSLALAEVMHRFIEQPSIDLGRRLASLTTSSWLLRLPAKSIRSD